ncbi:SPOR domain-containing protein [Pseudomonas mohnii]
MNRRGFATARNFGHDFHLKYKYLMAHPAIHLIRFFFDQLSLFRQPTVYKVQARCSFKQQKSSQLILALGHTDALKNLDHPRINNRTPLIRKNGINNYSLVLEMAAVRRLGLGFLITGVFGQLSALLWTYMSTGPICQNNVNNSYIQQKVTTLEQLLDDTVNKVATELNTKHFDGLTPLAKNGSHIPDSTEADAVQFLVEKPDETPVTLPSLPAQSYKWTIIFSGLITITGLLLAVFARKKTFDPRWHVFRTVPGSLITLERPCLTCGGYIFQARKEASTTPSSGLWVVEIALNTPSRHRAVKAIQLLELPIARKENNFVVIGPYKQKQDAARVVKELSEKHGVRGWMMAGN